MNKQQAPRLRFKGFAGKWEEKTLGEIFEISSASRVLKEQWQKEGVPFFRTSDVVSAFKGESNEEAFISFELFEDLVKKSGRPQKDDLLVTGGGSIGIPFLIKNDQPIYFKDADLLWFKSAGKINGSFLFYSFLSNEFKNYLKSISHTGTISHYTIIQAKSTPITLPTAPEQTHLGNFFRRLDNQIAESRAVLEKSRQLKKAMLAKMFPASGEKTPKIRFKGFEGEWECRKFSDVAELRRGLTYSPLDISQNGIRVLRSSNIDEEYYIEKSDDVFVFESAVNIPLVQNGDILITAANGSSRLVGKHAIIQTSEPAVHGGFMILARTENPYFLNASMSSAWYSDFIRIFVAGGNGAIGNLSISDLNEQQILIPSTLEEQTAIGNFFRQLDETIALQAAEVEKLTQLKKGLLAAMLV